MASTLDRSDGNPEGLRNKDALATLLGQRMRKLPPWVWFLASITMATIAIAALHFSPKRYPPKGQLGSQMKAAIAQDDLTFVQRQLDARLVNPDDEDSVGTTAIQLAAKTGDLDIVKALIKAGADVNHEDHAADDIPPSYRNYRPAGYTALDYAAGNNHPDIVELLVRAGADVNHIDGQGTGVEQTPLAHASTHPTIYKFLVAHGAKPILKPDGVSWSRGPTMHTLSWERAQPMLPPCGTPPGPYSTTPWNCSFIAYDADQHFFLTENWKREVPDDPTNAPPGELIFAITKRLGAEYGSCYVHGVAQDCSRLLASTPASAGETAVHGAESDDWLASDNGRDVTQDQAARFCDSLSNAPYGIGWTLASLDELRSAYDPASGTHVRFGLRISGAVWSRGDNQAFDFATGRALQVSGSTRLHMRALCIRNLGE